jgi:folate-dependent phosphoribosylglycinamide formyltransferase PurN
MRTLRPHISLFSQTGSEIVNIARHFNKWPDLIITNKRPTSVRVIDPGLIDLVREGKVIEISNTPTKEDYHSIFSKYDNPIITLHGWLRIIPESVCSKYEIYNGHPGLITEYPELKGKDPQLKAFKLGLSYSGAVIHKVTEGVDEGEIILSEKVNIEKLNIDEIFLKLRDCSQSLWITFFRQKFTYE